MEELIKMKDQKYCFYPKLVFYKVNIHRAYQVKSSCSFQNSGHTNEKVCFSIFFFNGSFNLFQHAIIHLAQL